MTVANAASGSAAVPEIVLDLVVSEKVTLAPDIVSVTMRARSGGLLPPWLPGAHLELLLPEDMIRQYSLCGPLEDRSSYRLGVLREPCSRGGSVYVHDVLEIGSGISARGPYNHFELEPASDYLFLAGGIGVTPLIAMATQARNQGAGVDFTYCGRARDGMGYIDELSALLGDHLRVHVDADSGVFDLVGHLREVRPGTAVYACGPAPFLDATLAATTHWPRGSIHFERFAPVVFDNATDVGFDVELASSGEVLVVPMGRSVLKVLGEHGVRVLSSCTEGTCGTCEVGVLAGGEDIEHRDVVLTPEERESGEMMMVCVSRSRGGRLTLDL